MTTTHTTLDLAAVQAAAELLRGVAHRTPVLTARTLDALTGASVHLKPECFQRTGSFKFRGAYNRLSALSPAQLERGVAAFSSGNHAQAVALAAKLLGTTATIAMPYDTPPVKITAARGYGAEIVRYDRYTEDREALGAALADERGMVLVPPYEHELVMAGQGTTALELLEDAGPLDLLLVPVGGGGLIAGCGTAAKGLHPTIRVVGVEPEAGDDTRRSLAAGERVRIQPPRTIIDGLMADIPGERTFAINRHLIDDIVTVSDAEVLDAVVFALERLNVLLEPSGAAALAALLAGRVDVTDQRVGVMLSGGNVDLDLLAGWLSDRRSVTPRNMLS